MRRIPFFPGLLIFLALVLLVLFLGRPVWTAWMLRGGERLASRLLGVDVRAQGLSVGLEEGIVLKKIRVGTTSPGQGLGEALLSVETIQVLPRWAEIVKGRVSLDSVRVVGSRLRIRKDSQGKWILSDFAPSGRKKKTERGRPPRWSIRRLALEQGSVILEGTEEPFVESLRIFLVDFSTVGEPQRGTFEGSAEVFAQGKIEVGGWIEARGKAVLAEARVSGTGLSFSLWKEWLAQYGFTVDETRVGCDLALEANSAQGVRVRGQIVLGPAYSSYHHGPVEEVWIRCDLSYDVSESRVRADTIEIEAGNTVRSALSGVLSYADGRAAFNGTVRVDRIDLSRLALPGQVQLAGLLSADSLRIKKDEKGDPPIIEGSARIQDWRASLGGFTLQGSKLGITLSKDPGIQLETLEPGFLAGKAGGPLQQVVPVRFSARAVLEHAGVRGEGNLELGAAEARLSRERDLSWDEAGLRLSGLLGRDRSQARLDGTLKALRYGDMWFPNVSFGADIDRKEEGLALMRPRVEGKGLSVTAGSVRVEKVARGEKTVVDLEGLDAAFPAAGVEIRGGRAAILWASGPGRRAGRWDFSWKGGRVQGVPLGRLSSSGRLAGSELQGSVLVRGPDSGTLLCRVKGKAPDRVFPLDVEIMIEDWDLKKTAPAIADRLPLGVDLLGRIRNCRFEGSVRSPEEITGRLFFDAVGLSGTRGHEGRFIFKDLILRGESAFQGSDVSWDLNLECGPLRAGFAGAAQSFARPERRLRGRVTVAPVELAALREFFWELTPDGMLYLGLEGSVSAEIDWAWDRGGFEGQGCVALEQVRLQGEYGEFSLGPVNGTIPVTYSSRDGKGWSEPFPVFNRSALGGLVQRLGGADSARGGSKKITIGEIAAGFPLVHNLELWIRGEEGLTRVDRISGEAFGGRILGTAVLQALPEARFKLGLVAQGIRLSSLCEVIQPIQGYLSGCVDGAASVEGSKPGGLEALSGRAEFWTYSKGCEKTRISRQLLEKIAGRSMLMLFRDRSYDKGELTVVLDKGFMVFQDLEISNRNLIGITDLSVRVAPRNNRIAVDHLLTSLTAAAARARHAQNGP